MNGRTKPDRPIHLSDDQLDSLLLGEAAPAAAAHLAGCPLCQARSEAFTATLGHFNQATLDWAEVFGTHASQAISAAPLASAARAGSLRFVPGYAWSFAAAILLVIAMLSLHSNFRTPVRTGRVAQPASVLQSGGDADPQIAADNILMANIDTALDQPDPLPLALNLESPVESAPVAPGESASSR